ncbi:MAG: NAD-dependent epimerase/dehydratase family protein [Candidatus Hydrogenedentota bacterium]
MSTQSILITGGAGFVGSSLAIGLGRHYPKARIIALDNLKRRGSELNLPRLNDAGIKFFHGDIRIPADLDEIGPVDLLIECSAEPSVMAGTDGAPNYLIDTNLLGSINCFEFARKHNAAVLFLSTSRVYPLETLTDLSLIESDTRFQIDAKQSVQGISDRGIAETCPLTGPRSLYGTTKLCSELLLQEYIAMYNIKGIINRCGIITGPWQMGKVDQGVVVLWAARHVYGGNLAYIGYEGTGKQVRDILHVNDLLKLIIHQVEHVDELSGELFNVGGGLDISISLQELTTLCAAHSGNSINITSVPEIREMDIPIYITDNTHVTQKTGWTPQTSPDTIVAEIVNWLQKNEIALKPILG